MSYDGQIRAENDIPPWLLIITVGFFVLMIGIFYRACTYRDSSPTKIDSHITNTATIDGMTCHVYSVGPEHLKYISCPNRCSATIESQQRLISADPAYVEYHNESVSSCLPASNSVR